MTKESKLNLNASDYAISHCDSDKTYNGLEVHKMLCDAYIAGNNDTFDDKDEEIRKALINVFATHKDYEMFFGVSVEDIRAWLEKQGEKEPTIEMKTPEESLGIDSDTYNEIMDECIYGDGEQNPTDKVEPKFHEGDWVFIEEVKGYKNGPIQIKTVDSFGYSFDEYHTISFMYEDLLSKWTIQDAKDGDVIYLPNDNNEYYFFIFKGIENAAVMSFAHFYQYNDGTSEVEGTIDNLCSVNDVFQPATKEQRDILFSKMKEAGYEWDAEKKELKKIDNEEVNGEDYGIDGLWHAQRILEKTLGEVDGYQTDDGILDHKAAITAVKKLYGQEPTYNEMKEALRTEYEKGRADVISEFQKAWSEEDESYLNTTIAYLKDAKEFKKSAENCINWLKSLKDRKTEKETE